MEAASAGHCIVARILLEFGAGINTHSNEFKVKMTIDYLLATDSKVLNGLLKCH